MFNFIIVLTVYILVILYYSLWTNYVIDYDDLITKYNLL